MPKPEERALQRWARKNIHSRTAPDGTKYRSVQEHRNAAVYGRMRKNGWKPEKPARLS